jgi:hypothetical protein
MSKNTFMRIPAVAPVSVKDSLFIKRHVYLYFRKFSPDSAALLNLRREAYSDFLIYQTR